MEEETNDEMVQKEEELEKRENGKSKNVNNEELEDVDMKKEREHDEKKQDQQEEEPQMKGDYENRDFPDPFYCPLTGKIMKDPVVHPDGTSFERSAVADMSDDVIYYPNRALQAIIQQEVLNRNITLQQTMDSMKKSLLGFIQRSNLSTRQDVVRPLSDQYYCSITYDIMENPVIDPDGQTFDRSAIFNWVRIHGNSPATRNPLSAKQLYKNTAIKNLLDEEVARDDESTNASIRRWKVQTEEQTEEDDDGKEWDLEEVNNLESVNTATTSTSMEDIEEGQHHQYGQARASKFKMYWILIVVFIACLFFIGTKVLFILFLK